MHRQNSSWARSRLCLLRSKREIGHLSAFKIFLDDHLQDSIWFTQFCQISPLAVSNSFRQAEVYGAKEHADVRSTARSADYRFRRCLKWRLNCPWHSDVFPKFISHQGASLQRAPKSVGFVDCFMKISGHVQIREFCGGFQPGKGGCQSSNSFGNHSTTLHYIIVFSDLKRIIGLRNICVRSGFVFMQ